MNKLFVALGFALTFSTVAADGSSAPGVVGFDIYRSHRPPLRNYQVDGDSMSADLLNKEYYYGADIEIGTPGQKLNVLIDTGSSDLWVISTTNKYCATNPNQRLIEEGGNYMDCTESGTFDSNKSSTFKYDDTNKFDIQYADSTYAKGRMATDVVNLGGTEIKNAIFGVANETNSTAVFGIGLQGLESSDKPYDNFPTILKKQKKIESTAYSLWLNDPNSQNGNILFGGVDQKKYSGDLETVPIVNTGNQDEPRRLEVILSSVSMKQYNKSDSEELMSGNIPVLLDSGTTDCVLPKKFTNYIGQIIGCQYSHGRCLVPCSDIDQDTLFEFDFSGKNIQVPLSYMFRPYADDYFSNGEAACSLDMGGGDSYILGDSFLRSAYVIFDLDNLEISLAQTVYNQTQSHILPIKSSVPNAKKAKHYSSTATAAPTVNAGTHFPGVSSILNPTGTLGPTSRSANKFDKRFENNSSSTNSSSSAAETTAKEIASGVSSLQTPSLFLSLTAILALICFA